jgi:ribosomal protein S18 acetylase RimI-like enzyme
MNNIVIRNLQEADFPEMMNIDQLVFHSSNTPSPIKQRSLEEFSKHYSQDKVFVAEHEGKIAGYIGYDNPTGLPSNSHVIELYIAVHPDYQGKGVGSALLTHLIIWGKQHEYIKVSLRVLSTNEGAVAFYKANGFLEQGRLVKEFVLNGVYVDDILMYQLL